VKSLARARLLFCLSLVLPLALPFAAVAQAPTPVTLRLDWAAVGTYQSGFYLAQTRGYYKDAGLDVKILEGRGSNTTIQLVGNGADTFGLADAAVAAKAIGLGVPVKVTMGLIRKSPVALFYSPEKGVKTPQDLKGKTIGSCPGHGAAILLPAYLKAVNLAPTDVKLVNMDCSAVLPMYAQGKVDIGTGYGPVTTTILRNLGMQDVKRFDYSDAGIILPSHGILASLKTIQTNPDLVRKFVAASARGWEEAAKNPAAAVDALVAAAPTLKGREAVLRAELEDYLKNYLNTPATVGKPFGWQSAEDWKKAEAILVQYMDVKSPGSVDAYFTNDFVGK
jgi:NitT/TauT family transport system substrate-binding protein